MADLPLQGSPWGGGGEGSVPIRKVVAAEAGRFYLTSEYSDLLNSCGPAYHITLGETMMLSHRSRNIGCEYSGTLNPRQRFRLGTQLSSSLVVLWTSWWVTAESTAVVVCGSAATLLMSIIAFIVFAVPVARLELCLGFALNGKEGGGRRIVILTLIVQQ